MDLSNNTEQELHAELEAMQRALATDIGRLFDGREERLRMKVAAIQAELEKRNAKKAV